MEISITNTITRTKDRLKQNARFLLIAIAILFGLEVLDIFLPARLSPDQFGVKPRQPWSLFCIPIYPWLHADFKHVWGNSMLLFPLGLLISLAGRQRLIQVTLVSVLVSGLGIFCLGAANSNHIGASGVVGGFLGYVVARGFIEKRIWAMCLSVLAGLYFFDDILGMLIPSRQVSWTAHAFGLLGGVLAAWLLAPKGERKLL